MVVWMIVTAMLKKFQGYIPFPSGGYPWGYYPDFLSLNHFVSAQAHVLIFEFMSMNFLTKRVLIG
jgi:hypothetical protein